MARRMNRAASALLPPSFSPSSWSSASIRSRQVSVQLGRQDQRAVGEGLFEPRDDGPGVVHRVALRHDQVADIPPGRVGSRARRSSREPPDRPPDADRPSAVARMRPSRRRPPRPPRAGSPRSASSSISAARSRRQSDSSTLIASSSHQRPSRKIDSRDAPLDDEAAALVGPDRPLVELEDEQRDAVQPERPERVLEHQPRRLGAVALAPGVLLADRDVVQRRAVVPVELAERAGADEAIRARGRGWPSPARPDRRPVRRRTARSPRRASALPGSAPGGRSRGRRTTRRNQASRFSGDVAAQHDPRPRQDLREPRSRRHRRNRIPSPPCAAGASWPSAWRRPPGPPRRPPSWPTTCAA